AARAGALLADMEFVQFHPTALDVGLDPMPLASEALRGEGAVLIDSRGEHFMAPLHAEADLAPRDVVARAIFNEGEKGQVYLDTRSALGASILEKFPTIVAACLKAGIDPVTQPMPVAPAAHYHMGGIAVDEWGRTSLARLWAAGEVSASGMHGANRLASNSLLEALSFATRVATDIKLHEPPRTRIPKVNLRALAAGATAEELVAIRSLRTVMYEKVGLVRNADGLQSALAHVDNLQTSMRQPTLALSNLLDVARLIVTAALLRKESRGSHYRSDFPLTDEAFAKRSFSTLQGVA
ncbi:MAG: FAD-binding protein, partial [Candidatus Eremiobacteraeota bacterium]|nr:FAD-binding protein [Candidatus Eremiobacteraeota bacterium]